MTTTLKLTSIGDGLGIVLPQEVVDRLQASDGGEIELVETANGAILQPACSEKSDSEDLQSQLAVARGVMQRGKEVLKRLAE